MMKDDELLMKVIDEQLVELIVGFFHSSFNIFYIHAFLIHLLKITGKITMTNMIGTKYTPRVYFFYKIEHVSNEVVQICTNLFDTCSNLYEFVPTWCTLAHVCIQSQI